jgi:hypothetical protein
MENVEPDSALILCRANLSRKGGARPQELRACRLDR